MFSSVEQDFPIIYKLMSKRSCYRPQNTNDYLFKNFFFETIIVQCRKHYVSEDLGGKRAPQKSFWCEVCQIPLYMKICFDKKSS